MPPISRVIPRGLLHAHTLIVALIVVLGMPGPVSAQQQLGAVQGTVTDPSDAVVPGVTITVTHVATGVVRSTVSNDRGVYRVPSLDPGQYDVTATLEGFRTVHRREIVVSVGANVGLDFQMQTGALAESIEVVGHSPDIQTQKADVSAVVEQRKLADLPLVGRNPFALATLQPGVVGIPTSTDLFATEQGMGINVNGQRESGNNAVVDGVTISNGPWTGRSSSAPTTASARPAARARCSPWKPSSSGTGCSPTGRIRSRRS